MILGKNIIIPIKTDPIANNKTELAARSFAAFARGFFFNVTRSTTLSTALFIASALHTAAIVKINIQNSVGLILNMKAQIITMIVKKR